MSVGLTLALALGCARQLGKDSARGVLDALEPPVAGTAVRAGRAGPAAPGDDGAPGDRGGPGDDGAPVGAGAAGVTRASGGSPLARDFARIVDSVTRTATASAIDQVEQHVDRRLDDLSASLAAPDGQVARAVEGLSAAATRGAVATYRDERDVAFAAACPDDLTLRACLRREARALGRELTAGAFETLGWPMLALLGSLIVFLLSGSALMIATLLRRPRRAVDALTPAPA